MNDYCVGTELIAHDQPYCMQDTNYMARCYYIQLHNLKIMNLKREWGSIIAIKSKETKCRSCTSQHWVMYVANHYLPSQLDEIQMLVKSTTLYPYFGRKTKDKYNKSQSKDKILQIILRAGGMSSQLVQPNLKRRTMQLNAWVSDNFMNIEILFLPLIL